jgi:hypothetical protein
VDAVSNQHGWLTGLQAYAYDVIDEGAEAVVEAASSCAADVILLAVSYLDHFPQTERGTAPLRNPHRKLHGMEAYIRPSPGHYPAALIPPLSDDPGADGEAAYSALREVAEPRGIAVVPWVLLLTHPVARQAPAYGVVNARGEVVPGWLCASRPEATEFARALLSDVVDKFQPSAIFLDGIRFPSAAVHGLVDLFSCFCDACHESARAQGLDLAAARKSLLALADLVEKDPAEAARLGSEIMATGLTTLRTVARHPAVLDWIEFRHRAIDRLVKGAQESIAGNAELWLDVWPPSYGWLLGQDLARLGHHGSWTKPFTYHRWGGGANIPAIIGRLSSDPVVLQQLYGVYRAFFGFAGPSDFGEYAERGLDPDWVTSESALAASLLGGHSKLAAGLQLWQVGPTGVREALDSALKARPDGVFLHCYGWSTLEELHAAGDWLREHGLARR